MVGYRKRTSGVPARIDNFCLKVCLLLIFHVSRTIDAFETLPTNHAAALLTNSRNGSFLSTKSSLSVASTLTDDDDAISYTSARSPTFSTAAEWHRQRRKAMIDKYGDQIIPLERNSSSEWIGVPLLIIANFSLLMMSLISGVNDLEVYQIFGLALFPGSMFSLWQLQILHDCLHGSLFQKQSQRQQQSTDALPKASNSSNKGRRRKQLQNDVIFWGSMPSIFGYFLYLKYGHLTHHSNVGDPERASLEKLFNSDQSNFEDGDVLFVAHRMKLKGEIGPTFELPFFRDIPLLPEKNYDEYKQKRI